MQRTPVIPPYRPRTPTPMSHIGHQNHLCYLVTYITLNELKHIVQNPHYICKTCGRVTAREENLCTPTPL